VIKERGSDMKALTHSRWSIAGFLLAVVVCCPVTAVAADDAAAEAAAGQVDALAGAVAIDGDSLEQYRGGAELNLYDIRSDGVVRDNQAYNLSTGSNFIADGSFAGASGFATAVQNSGNNVLIQNATIINVQVR
jgi:hypothetical protein